MNSFIPICGTAAGLIILLNAVFLMFDEPTSVFQQMYVLLSWGIGGGLILLSAIVVNTKKDGHEDFYNQQELTNEGPPPPPPAWAEELVESKKRSKS